MFLKYFGFAVITPLILINSNLKADVLCENSGQLVVVRATEACPAGLGTINLQNFGKLGTLVRGPTGDIGQKGERGPVGAIGKTGKKGDKGARGPVGEKGATGPAGSSGKKGARGDVGQQGLKGDKGATGAQGAKGPQGDGSGVAGPKGDAGPNSTEVGPQGQRGPNGLQGQAGRDVLWKEAINTSECVEKTEHNVIAGATPYDNTTKSASVVKSCDPNQFLYNYSFSTYGKLNGAVTRLTIPHSISYVSANYIDRIQANYIFKLIGANWESAEYDVTLVCCNLNPLDS